MSGISNSDIWTLGVWENRLRRGSKFPERPGIFGTEAIICDMSVREEIPPMLKLDQKLGYTKGRIQKPIAHRRRLSRARRDGPAAKIYRTHIENSDSPDRDMQSPRW